MGLKAVNDLIGNVQDNIERSGEMASKDPGAFLQDWIKTNLPDAVVDLAIKVGGREDGSGFLAQQALDLGQDKNLLGGILKQ